MDDNLQVLPGHFMGWSEADSNLLFMERLGSVKEKNRDIFAMTDSSLYL